MIVPAMLVLGCAMAGVLLALLAGFDTDDPHHDPFEAHHGYWGAGLVLLSGFLPSPWSWIVLGLGVVLWLDDMVQHTIQIWKPGFRSPVHNLWYFHNLTGPKK